jgi:Tol biopolymer transport system component
MNKPDHHLNARLITTALALILLLGGCAAREHDPRLTYVAARGGSDQVYLHDLTSGLTRQLTSGAGDKADPAFSRDGEWVFYSGDADGDWDIYRVNVEDGEVEKLTWNLTNERFPAATTWDDGVVYLSENDGGPTLWVINEPGDSEPLEINLELFGDFTYARWDRRGNWLAYTVEADDYPSPVPSAAGNIWRYNHGAMFFEGLIEDFADNRHPCWSADARWLVFASNRGPDGADYADPDADYDLFLFELDQGEIIRLTDDPGDELWPIVEHDNESLIFYGELDGVSGLYRRSTTSGRPRYELLVSLEEPPNGVSLHP